MCETCRDQDIGTKIERLLSGRSKKKKKRNYTNERTTARHSRAKPNGWHNELIMNWWLKHVKQWREEINELKYTTEDINNEVMRMEKVQIEMRNNNPEQIKKSEEKTEKKNGWTDWLKVRISNAFLIFRFAPFSCIVLLVQLLHFTVSQNSVTSVHYQISIA